MVGTVTGKSVRFYPKRYYSYRFFISKSYKNLIKQGILVSVNFMNNDFSTDPLNPLLQQVPQSAIKSSSSKRKWWALAVLIVIFVGFGVVFSQFANKPQQAAIISEEEDEQQVVPADSDIPFAEMTIPYLRDREYTSTLGELSLVGNNGSYESYLTSYDSDGLTINAQLTRPVGEEPSEGWPAIVFVHGYIPPTQYETLGKYVEYVNYLARNGFVVLKIDLRGHGDSEGEPGGGYYSSDYIIDTLHARAALQNAEFVNKDAVGLWGHSMAGNVLMRSMAARPEIPAVVIWAGAVYTYLDQREYGIQDSSYMPPQDNTERQNRRRELFEKHGSPSAQSVFWQQVAPTNYLNDLQGAVALHHAVNDDVVDVRYSRGLNELLDQTDVPHEVYEYESGGHNISEPSFSVAMQRTVDFFEKYLQ